MRPRLSNAERELIKKSIQSAEKPEPATLNHILDSYAELTSIERQYLRDVVQQTKPKRILEIGVSHGGSAVVLLDATRDTGARITSLDYLQQCYKAPSKQTGWIVHEMFVDLSDRWTFKGGGVVCQYLEEVSRGEKFDMLFLDTAHQNPGEFLNILEALPHLDKGAVVVLHDTALYTIDLRCTTNHILLSTLKGKRILFDDPACPNVPNIGGIVLDDPMDRDMLWALFANTALPWTYTPPFVDCTLLHNYYLKHYDKRLVNIFDKSVERHYQGLTNGCPVPSGSLNYVA